MQHTGGRGQREAAQFLCSSRSFFIHTGCSDSRFSLNTLQGKKKEMREKLMTWWGESAKLRGKTVEGLWHRKNVLPGTPPHHGHVHRHLSARMYPWRKGFRGPPCSKNSVWPFLQEKKSFLSEDRSTEVYFLFFSSSLDSANAWELHDFYPPLFTHICCTCSHDSSRHLTTSISHCQRLSSHACRQQWHLHTRCLVCPLSEVCSQLIVEKKHNLESFT